MNSYNTQTGIEIDFKGILDSSCIEKQQYMWQTLIGFDRWERIVAGFILFEHNYLCVFILLF